MDEDECIDKTSYAFIRESNWESESEHEFLNISMPPVEQEAFDSVLMKLSNQTIDRQRVENSGDACFPVDEVIQRMSTLFGNEFSGAALTGFDELIAMSGQLNRLGDTDIKNAAWSIGNIQAALN